MSRRKAIKPSVAREVKARARCASCGDQDGPFEIDHGVPVALGGGSDVGNLVLLCRRCHLVKTAQDVRNIAKARRLEAQRLGTRKPKWKRKLDGRTVKE